MIDRGGAPQARLRRLAVTESLRREALRDPGVAQPRI